MTFCKKDIAAKKNLYVYELTDIKFSQMSDTKLSIFGQPKLETVVTSDH